MRIDRNRNAILKRQIKIWIQITRRGKRVSVRHLAKLIGKLSQTRVQHSRASMYLSKLNRLKTQAVLRHGWNGTLRMKQWALNELMWWNTQLRQNKPVPIRVQGNEITLYTDASPHGWGGWMEQNAQTGQQQLMVHGAWKESFIHSSNYHEMMAVFLCLKHFVVMNQMKAVQRINLRTDNTTVLYDINKKRGASTLLHPLKLIMQLAENRHWQIHANHIAGVDNVIADKLSRLARSGDYALDQTIFNSGVKQLGVTIDIDLFATKANRKCSNYMTLTREEEASGRDALSTGWGRFCPLIHPPIPLLLRCLRKVKEEGVMGVVIAPMWTGQPWSHLLRELTVNHRNLGQASDILIPGKSMRTNGRQLPPGTMGMYLVDARMKSDGTCGKQ
jgi:hypothetical protein